MADPAVIAGSIEDYMLQYLQTATKGNVRVTFAFITNRMHLHCDKCHVGLTVPRPENSHTIDYSVQEYVKIHAHVGGYTPPEKILHPLPMQEGGQAVTFDFKKVEKKMIDLNPGKAAIIQQTVAKMEEQYKELLDDAALANKIKLLQMGDAPSAKKKELEEMKAEADQLFEEAKFNDYNALAEEIKKKELVLKQLELQEVQAKVALAKHKAKSVPSIVEHVPVKPAPVVPAANNPFEDTGRKFR